ncbi:transporter substrate-binding domain-containing protein [Alteromonas sp. IB21]|uniref:substrate-binding periplasmic protein n=1 Tax=Alteromonas sp. IB21 TaxID=2779369 RepID=UPI0018E845BB|nr:transporter substrate-binding domain-containing protein [Alteromonas sp. IB21]
MPIFHFSLTLLCSLLCLTTFYCRANTQDHIPSVRFAVNTPGSAPYLYYDESAKRYQGVVVDFFNADELSSQFRVVYLDSNRARSEDLLKSSSVDLFLSSESWISKPNSFLFSEELIKHESYIYSTTNFEGPFVPEENVSSSICTRYGFVYPALTPYFDREENNIDRVDSSSQSTMAMMLSRGRCDFAIMNEHNARSVMFDPKFCSTEFYQSPNVISRVSLVFVIRSGFTSLKDKIDIALKHFVESGQRQLSFERHSGVNQFPKAKC